METTKSPLGGHSTPLSDTSTDHQVQGDEALKASSSVIEQKVSLLERFFMNRTDKFAIRSSAGTPQPATLADGFSLRQLLQAHVDPQNAESVAIFSVTNGRDPVGRVVRARVGSYTPALDGTALWGCIDFDGGAGHANALKDPLAAALSAFKKAKNLDLATYLEKSGGGFGWHLWFFMEAPTETWKVRALGLVLASSEQHKLMAGGLADPHSNKGIEVFPKTARLGAEQVGGMVWLPWWGNCSTEGGNEIYALHDDGSLVHFVPENLLTVSVAKLEQILSGTGATEETAFPKERCHTAERRSGNPEDVSRSRPSSDFQAKVDAYNQANRREYPKPGTGTCPACGHHNCFGQLADNPLKWACFSASHGVSGVGHEGTNCWWGDALDLDAAELGRDRRELLTEFIREAEVLPLPLSANQQLSPNAALAIRPTAASAPVQMADAATQPLALPPTGTSASSKAEIKISTDEIAVNTKAIEALALDPEVFQRGPTLVHVIRDDNPPPSSVFPPGMPRIGVLPLAKLRERLTAVATWVTPKTSKDGKEVLVPAHPPAWAVSGVAARGTWDGIRKLVAIVEAPVLRPDGTVLQKAGYDESTGLLYEPSTIYPVVPDAPTLADAKSALAELLDVVFDFPFESPAHQSAWVAATLTPIARFAFHGSSPLFLADANVRGAGKGLLFDATALIATGHPMALIPMEEADEEMRKQITTHAVAGTRLILIDNVDIPLGGASLDKALTRDRWSDRLLGINQFADVPLLASWYATGNNVVLKGDMGRRVLHIRLRSEHERPEKRDGFKHSNLKAYVAANRGRLTVAALTILRAYFVARCPEVPIATWGSFEDWSKVVRRALVWVGMSDPAETRDYLVENADTEANALYQLLNGWSSVDPNGTGLTASQLLQQLDSNTTAYSQVRDAINELCPQSVGKLMATRLGKRLHHLLERVVDGKQLINRPGPGHTKVWLVREVGGASPPISGPEPVADSTYSSSSAEFVPETDNPDFS